ncbi:MULTISPECIES: nucleoside/nucleotide kinase family protein [Dermacoccus]|uniref:nucleoside/nucleotide kinase family protein n=1 Tax=Dermacoccus TaxID=57495 RepID=UPI00237B2480|nr:nucleoside/nucleotide kinase family protein [Dermacoccus abyssi]
MHASPHDRLVLAVAGAPGAGKSTVCELLLAEAQNRDVSAIVVPMDGWHLAHRTLERLGLAQVKGAPQTFDAEGFVALVARIAGQRPGDPSVWAPEFRREIEDAVTGAVEIRPEHRLVVVEGNYLLLDEHPWRNLAGFFDTAWVLTPDESTRRIRLVERHERYGRSTEDARAHALGSDETNARRIEHNMVARAGLTVLEVDPG